MNTETNLTPTPIPITLNCSGGVSLGAYMAGVLYELTQEALQPQPKIIIDIITGSSAGAMSGAVAAYYLLGGDNLLTKSPEKSAFYQTWVEQADIKNIDNMSFFIQSLWQGIRVTIDSFRDSIKLTRKRKKPTAKQEESPNSLMNRPHLSIFSREAIDKITETVQPKGGMKPPEKPLALLMTVTNLQGILEQVVFNDSKTIKTITSSETRQFLFHSALEANRLRNMWNKVVKGAQASGAFPVAFPPVRDNSNINSVNMAKISNDYYIEIESTPPIRELKNTVPKSIRPIPPDEKTLSFLYTDGGILDGLPIAKGIALEKNLELEEAGVFSEKDKPFVREWKKLNLDNRKRLYVYIQPTPIEKLTSEARLTKGYFSAIEIGLSAFTLPWEEHDAIRLNEILRRNRDAQRKQKLRWRLAEKFGTENLAEIDTILDEAIPYRFINLKRIDPSIIGTIYQSSSLQSLLPIYEALPDRIKQNLQEKNTKGILASDFLGAFGGFFDKRYREHDFLLGRISGLTWLCQNCQVEISESKINDLLAQMQGKNKKILDIDPKPSDLKLSQKIRIGKLALRALRIAVIESTIIGNFWIVSLGVIKLTVIFLLTLLEIIATLLTVVIELLEKYLFLNSR